MKKYFVSFRVPVSSKVFYDGAIDCFMQDCNAYFGYDFDVKIKRTDFDTFSIIVVFSDKDFFVEPTYKNILYAIRKGREFFGNNFTIERHATWKDHLYLADCIFENGKCTHRVFETIYFDD